MTLPEPQSTTFSNLLNEIEKGQIKIPQFQRDFVWDIKKSANLMDSIIKGYPIGTFIFWKTNERLRSVRNMGDFNLPEPEDGDFVNYVLDGQQRLTSLFASLKGLKIKRDENKTDDYAELYVDLEAKEDEQIVILEQIDKSKQSLIRITDLLYAELTQLVSYPSQYHKTISEYKKRIESYNYSIILIKEAPIDIATEIFTRINVGGKPLSLFEIMVAKTYEYKKVTDLNTNEEKIYIFDLSDKFKILISDLTPVNYETISDATVLQTVAMILSKDCSKKAILKLDKSEFINTWPAAVDAIKSSIEYFRDFYRIPVSQLLPYNALIVPFSYFFYHHKDKPTGDKQKYLQDFFWRCSISGRYSSSVESKLAQDIKKIDNILANQLPNYEWSVDTSKDFIIKYGWFNAGKAFIKSILSLYAYHQPKSFNDESIVNISNYWLKQANSKNYHHFFPRAFLRKRQEEEFFINHIANITIVDDFLNKREIRAQAPSKYMKRFLKHNSNLSQTMSTHLITDLDEFGIWEDDYNKFFDCRVNAISKELDKRIIKQDIDKQNITVVLEDDAEEPVELELINEENGDSNE